MKKSYLIFSILLLQHLGALSQNIPNDTIIKKDGTQIIDNFKTLVAYEGYFISSTHEISQERIEAISENDLKKIAIPLEEVHKVIDHSIYEKRRKNLNDDDVIWQSETNNHKRKVWVHQRFEKKTLILPDGELALLELLVEGPCDLYFGISSGYSFNFSTNSGVGIGPTTENFLYFFKRKGEMKSTLFEGSRDDPFKRYGEFVRSKKLDYFDDCPQAKDFLEEKKMLSKNDIIELVELYNNNCF